MLCDTAPLGLQVLSAQTIPQSSISNSSPSQTTSATPVTDQSPVQPISTTAASDGSSDVSMQEVDSSTSTPKQNYMSPVSSPDGRNPAPPAPVAQNLDSQISTPPLKKRDDEPSEGYSQPNTVQRDSTPATCTEAVSRFVNTLQKTALKYHSLTGEEKDMVAKHIRSLPVPMTGLTDLMNVVSINTSKVVRKRKSDDPTFQPSEDDFDPPSPSPGTSRSKKLNVRDAKDSRLHESRNSNSKDVETELDIATFRKVSGRESRGPISTGGIAEQAAHIFCQKLFHFGKFVEKGTPKFARKIPEFVEKMSQPAELNLASTALGMPINNDGDRKMATKELIQAYHEDQYNLHCSLRFGTSSLLRTWLNHCGKMGATAMKLLCDGRRGLGKKTAIQIYMKNCFPRWHRKWPKLGGARWWQADIGGSGAGLCLMVEVITKIAEHCCFSWLQWMTEEGFNQSVIRIMKMK
jgi:hypothetical protein